MFVYVCTLCTYVHTLHPVPGLNSQPRVHESYSLLSEPARCLWPSSISLIKDKFFPTLGFCVCYSLSSLCLANSSFRSWVISNSNKGVSLNPINLCHHCSSSKHSSFPSYHAPLFLFHIVLVYDLCASQYLSLDCEFFLPPEKAHVFCSPLYVYPEHKPVSGTSSINKIKEY